MRNVVDGTGIVTDTILYDAYGNITTESSLLNGGAYKYVGYRFDSETGLLRPDPTMARYYDPRTGRWWSVDPIEFAGGDVNLWRYVANIPTASTDPDGLATEKECIDAVAAIKSEQWYTDLAKQFGNKGLPEIECVKEGKGAEPGTVGQYNARNNTVYIYFGDSDAIRLKRTIAHELVHAYDEAKGLKAIKADLRAIKACTELRTYCFPVNALLQKKKAAI